MVVVVDMVVAFETVRVVVRTAYDLAVVAVDLAVVAVDIFAAATIVAAVFAVVIVVVVAWVLVAFVARLLLVVGPVVDPLLMFAILGSFACLSCSYQA